MIVAHGAAPPEAGQLKGFGFLGPTAEAAERAALDYVGQSEAAN